MESILEIDIWTKTLICDWKEENKRNEKKSFGWKPEMDLSRMEQEREYYKAVVKFLIYALLRSY